MLREVLASLSQLKICIHIVATLPHFKAPFFSSSVFEEPEDPTNRSFFSEIISSISDVKFSNSGRYMISRDYLSVKVWDLHMETKPVETYTVSEGGPRSLWPNFIRDHRVGVHQYLPGVKTSKKCLPPDFC